MSLPDKELAYCVAWASLGDTLLDEEWVYSYEGPNPAFPGLMIEVETDWTDDQVMAEVKRIAWPYLMNAAKISKRGMTRNLRYG